MSGIISVNSAAAMAISLSLVTLIFYMPMGYGFAISALVGGALGKGDIAKAKKIALIAIGLC